jgi:hypothetical protein
MLRALLTFGIGGVVFGALFVSYGFKERDVAASSTQAPETIALKDLIARGPEGNANIILTDYALCDNLVIEKKGSLWQGVWVPVVPKDAAGPDGRGGSPAAFQAVIYSTRVRNEGQVSERLAQPQLPGLVVNKLRSLDGKQKKLLQDSYPQTDFSTCLIIHEGREPSSETKSALLIYGGIGAVAVGLGLLGLALVVWRKRAAEGTARRPGRGKGLYPRGEDGEDDRPRKRRTSARDDEDDEPPRRKRRIADDDEDDPAPRKRRPAARDEDEDDDRPRRKYREEDEDRPRRRPRRDRDD